MKSHNPTGAVNQQERPGFEQWIVGFVDGEGCFSISVVRNRGMKLGWQVQHEFSVTQAANSRSALEALGRYFGCGRIIENSRRDNHREPLLRYSVTLPSGSRHTGLRQRCPASAPFRTASSSISTPRPGARPRMKLP